MTKVIENRNGRTELTVSKEKEEGMKNIINLWKKMVSLICSFAFFL